MTREALDHGEQLRHYGADPAYDTLVPVKLAPCKVREPLPAYADDDTAAFVERWSRRAKWLQRACYALLVLMLACFCAIVMLWQK